jgi:hypothetical protein
MPLRDGDTQERTRRAQRLARPLIWPNALEDALRRLARERFYLVSTFFIRAGEVQNGISGATPARHRSESSFAPFASRLAANQDETLFPSLVRPAAKGADRNDRRDGSEQWITSKLPP